MSADAKANPDKTGYFWTGCHDGECRRHSGGVHDVGLPLLELLQDMEACRGVRIVRWEIHTYPDGSHGLKGWSY